LRRGANIRGIYGAVRIGSAEFPRRSPHPSRDDVTSRRYAKIGVTCVRTLRNYRPTIAFPPVRLARPSDKPVRENCVREINAFAKRRLYARNGKGIFRDDDRTGNDRSDNIFARSADDMQLLIKKEDAPGDKISCVDGKMV